MKTLIITLMIGILLIATGKNSYSQVTYEVTVSNQVVTGSDVSFDIYLQSTDVDPLYLGDADLVLFFNSANFTAPTFEYEMGSCVLTNSLSAPTNFYDANIVTDPSFLASGQLVINILMPVFGNQTQFNERIARVGFIPGVDKLGTFTITGINNPTGSLGLSWKTTGPGIYSIVQTLANTDPWTSSTVIGTFPPPFDQPLPVSISSFTGMADKNNVTLSWATEWEENNDRFDVQRKLDQSEIWTTIGSVAGAGTSNETQNYSYSDKNLTTGNYEYRLIAIDYNGNETADNEHTIRVDVGIPTSYNLSQNYPNPFNPTTKISFELPLENMVSLKIYDLTGREIANLVNEVMSPGYYTTEFNASSIASGVYFYRLVTGNATITKKMMILK